MRFDRQDNQNAADAAYQHRNDPIGMLLSNPTQNTTNRDPQAPAKDSIPTISETASSSASNRSAGATI